MSTGSKPVGGLETATVRLKRALQRLMGRTPAPQVVAHHPFDLQHGVETSGLITAPKLTTGHPHDAYNTAYFGVPPSRFTHLLERWRTTPGSPRIEDTRFVDIGCGKGRALLLASQLPFREVVGVELHTGLAETARANAETWKTHERASAPIRILCGDATELVTGLLDGPVVLYMYNAFRPPVLRLLLESCTRRMTGPLDILYLYPEHESSFAEFPELERVWLEEIPLSQEDSDDGLSSAFDPCVLYRATSSRRAG